MSSRKTRNTLKFSQEELKISGQDKKISALEKKSEKLGQKLDKAHQKLPAKKVRSKERVFSEKSGKPKFKLTFKKEPVPINQAKWNRPKQRSLPRKATGAVTTAGINALHSKVRESEHENAGVQVGHRLQLMGESAVRGVKKTTHSAYRFVRNTPYRRASKLEAKSVKNEMKLTYRKALRDNPKLKSNPVSRMFQKRQIKKQYAKAFRSAKKTGQTVKHASTVVQKASQLMTSFLRRNPILLIKVGALALIIFLIMGLFAMCAAMFSGGTSYIGATTYAAADTDINNAELSYTQWETDLRVQIANTETTYPGYDEYRYNIGNVGHNPLELMAYLTAVYNDFTYAQVEPVLRQIFGEQYQLTFTPSTETRYRTETQEVDTTDPVTGEVTVTYQNVQVPYDWHVMTVTLTSVTLDSVIEPMMNSDQQQQYYSLIQSRGNRQYVGNPFDTDWVNGISSYYGYRISPITGQEEFHQGVDIPMPTGTPVHAGFDGTVVSAQFSSSYGNNIIIQNAAGIEARYAHLDTMLVTAGQTIKLGDVIGTVGSTGDSTGPHLHLEVIENGQTINPIYFAVSSVDTPIN